MDNAKPDGAIWERGEGKGRVSKFITRSRWYARDGPLPRRDDGDEAVRPTGGGER